MCEVRTRLQRSSLTPPRPGRAAPRGGQEEEEEEEAADLLRPGDPGHPGRLTEADQRPADGDQESAAAPPLLPAQALCSRAAE